MTFKLAMHSLYNAIKCVQTSNVESDSVECSVWRGGSSIWWASVCENLVPSAGCGHTIPLRE
ncbi:hypothetical protein IM737_00685 [Devosia sp. SL43]|nr:hypothetical protein IM737_00685 [Devosia sp. SL43]